MSKAIVALGILVVLAACIVPRPTPTVSPISPILAPKTPTPAPTPPGGLVRNSSLELPYIYTGSAHGVANNWLGWQVDNPCPGGQIGHPGCFIPCPATCKLPNGNCNNDPGCSWQSPEFTYRGLPNTFRIHSGSGSQSYFGYGRMIWAGLYQTVTVTPGETYLFSIWQMVWECANYDLCQGGQHSDQRDPFHLRIGIDPLGGTDPFGENVIWSPEGEAFDRWVQFYVTALAQSSTITLFTHARSDVGTGYLPTNMDVYIDDARLVSVSQTYLPVVVK